MSGFAQAVPGLALAGAGWIAPRRVAGARRLGAASLLDAAPLAWVWLALLAGSGRPVFAGSVAFALGAGFAFADRIVRDTLREPMVFSALSELPQVFTHPHLYLPFAGTSLVIGGAAAGLGAGLALLVAEPAVMTPRPLAALSFCTLVAGVLWLLGREPWLGGAARALRRLGPSGEPFADAALLGPVAMLLVHGILARAERPLRRASLAPIPSAMKKTGASRPIVLVQCESFFDARRALPGLPDGFLAGFDCACGSGLHGRLAVPAWGANTMRAEFAVLTGVAEAALGYDRFNPYHALARVPLRSQVRRLRAAGYRTVCLHPFDKRFFRRDLAMPALGFEEFFGRETLGGRRAPPYLCDPELADHILRFVDELGPRVFVFAITMGNHGPWLNGLASHPEPTDEFADRGLPQRAELMRYLAGLRQSDAMLRRLIAGLERRGDAPLLGFYGDHLPSLPRAFAALGFEDWRSDYAIWSAAGTPSRRDLAAHELGSELVDLALAAPAVVREACPA